MLNFALSSIPKKGKNAHLTSPASEATNLIRNDSLSSEEYETKNCKYLKCRTSYNDLKQG